MGDTKGGDSNMGDSNGGDINGGDTNMEDISMGAMIGGDALDSPPPSSPQLWGKEHTGYGGGCSRMGWMAASSRKTRTALIWETCSPIVTHSPIAPHSSPQPPTAP